MSDLNPPHTHTHSLSMLPTEVRETHWHGLNLKRPSQAHISNACCSASSVAWEALEPLEGKLSQGCQDGQVGETLDTHTCEDLKVSPQKLSKKPGVLACTCHLRNGDAEREGCYG